MIPLQAKKKMMSEPTNPLSKLVLSGSGGDL